VAEATPGLAPVEAAASGSALANEAVPEVSFSVVEEDTVLSRLLVGASWIRVVALLVLFAIVLYAFLRKSTRGRWVALSVTLIYLGFIDGGFLSVSHLTSAINVGPLVYLQNLPLLLLIGFTAVTTLLWGRLFCGYLCPFGVLQDFLERVVPRRFRRSMPQSLHDRALYIKYGLLALILILAWVRSDVSIYQYLEPFGTVFFRSPSTLLWLIAIGLLALSAIVPRFYCRYVCPLGAALGVASFLSFFRITRVDQCHECKVCEQACPVGAIRRSDIDFKECVRCDVCEVKLLTQAGACQHSMDVIRARLKEGIESPDTGWRVQ
jgi:polyferredoxin